MAGCLATLVWVRSTPRNPGSSPCHARAPKVTASSASPASVAGAWLGSLPRLTDLQVGEETACPTRCGPVWKSEIQTIKSAAKSCSSKAIQSLALQGPRYMPPPPTGTCSSLGLCAVLFWGQKPLVSGLAGSLLQDLKLQGETQLHTSSCHGQPAQGLCFSGLFRDHRSWKVREPSWTLLGWAQSPGLEKRGLEHYVGGHLGGHSKASEHCSVTRTCGAPS